VVTPPVEPPVTPPVVTPPVEPPTPPVVTPPPSADICTIAPSSALCQVLSPPTASEPVKPVQTAANEVIKTVSASTPRSETGGPAATSSTPDDKAEMADKADTKELASNDKPGTKNEPAKKMYCN
jgi:hypothetical protein